MHLIRSTFLGKATFLLITCFLWACVDAVDPEFRYQEGLVYIDALASTVPGTSFVKITQSTREFDINTNVFIKGARVSFIESNTGNEIDLVEQDDAYIPPADFALEVGSTWELRVVLEDGREYWSEQETTLPPVEIMDVKVEYDPELLLIGDSETRAPGHSLSVTFIYPPEDDNYYYWNFQSFERLIYCATCFTSLYRNGGCITIAPALVSAIKPYYTYGCSPKCWRIRFNDDINIFSDKFTNGNEVKNFPAGKVPLFTKENIVVELRQFSLTPSAHSYYETLNDIVDNNSGFNSPIPAVLVGNLFNPNDNEEFVLGRFTAVGTSTKSVFIERTFVLENQIEKDIFGQFEGLEVPVGPITTNAPCEESRYRTSILPEGWIE
ncbi:DUF4249 domain-containing protein [Ulvibacterium sp.]|uniref:DUF4249 domain-containing protein n=1 Tax=Ulvibacterium sp. TaxID=2665914 RepID=UPI00260FB584|nr:DUF4249 domain-containing protein [Ulvibacterium sp.]